MPSKKTPTPFIHRHAHRIFPTLIVIVTLVAGWQVHLLYPKWDWQILTIMLTTFAVLYVMRGLKISELRDELSRVRHEQSKRM